MKKLLLIAAIAGLTVLALGAAGVVYVQAQTPTPDWGPGMMGPGHGHNGLMGQGYHGSMMGQGFGHGMMGAGFDSGEMGVMQATMHPAMAAALGLTTEEFDARRQAGETFLEIAESQGLTSDEAWVLMQATCGAALQQAVADGLITEDFAGQMLARMAAMHGKDFGPGAGSCHKAETGE